MKIMNQLPKLTLRESNPDFLDLPWYQPLSEWTDNCERCEELPRGISRHPVVFANYDSSLFALKELPLDLAEKEYNNLLIMEKLRLSSVSPVGYAQTSTIQGQASVLITRYLSHSIPYRLLFKENKLVRYRESLLDAIAGLMVQLHLAGIYWGDCSLSNTLFRRDDGALRAYLVDAETSELYLDNMSPTLRHHDLEIMEENIKRELAELVSLSIKSGVPTTPEMGAYIRLQYQKLWEEITREDIINSEEHYRIQERIRAMNALGFSIGEVELFSTANGNQLRLRVFVTDQNFHHDHLFNLTGVDAEEMQARKLMNEIHEHKATLSQVNYRSTSLSAAAYDWLENIYHPTLQRLQPLVNVDISSAELYCQLLEHKWYLSEKAQHDVGHQTAVEDFVNNFFSEQSSF
jgi:hypothetical protein